MNPSNPVARDLVTAINNVYDGRKPGSRRPVADRKITRVEAGQASPRSPRRWWPRRCAAPTRRTWPGSSRSWSHERRGQSSSLATWPEELPGHPCGRQAGPHRCNPPA